MTEYTFETVTIINDTEITLSVSFDYGKAEPRNYYSPGYPEQVDINGVTCSGVAVPDWLVDILREQLKEDALEYIHGVAEIAVLDRADYEYDRLRNAA